MDGDEFVPPEGNWQVYLLGFGRDGWTEQSHDFATEVATTQPTGAFWA
jgi:hypothetical protein